MNDRVIPIIQVAYKSEWALARFFEALRDGEITKKFALESICGRETSDRAAITALNNRIKEIKTAIKAKEWRAEQREKEIENTKYLLSLLETHKVKYFEVRRDGKLPQDDEPKLGKTIVIHSSNITHNMYIKSGFAEGADILCEKPLTTVVDTYGKPDHGALVCLDSTVNNFGSGLILMDAEHYSYKKPALIFYEKLEELLKDKNGNSRKIKSLEGEIKEIDKPDWKRTREILSFKKNQTGLLGDTMCHLLAFVSNIGGRSVPETREYDSYPEFDADTYDSVNYKIINDDIQKSYFSENATAIFTVGKFIDKMEGAFKNEEESKFIKFKLDDNSEIKLNFIDGTITKDGKDCSYFRYAIPKNEYVNVLNEFHEAKKDHRRPLTNYISSRNTLQSIFETYALPEEKNRRIKVY